MICLGSGGPWELGLAETHQALILNGLRGLVTLETDGHIRNGTDIVKGALIGADNFGLGTAPLISIGCIMSKYCSLAIVSAVSSPDLSMILVRQCHTGLCPVGIATQDPELRKKFKGQPEYIVNYFFLIAEEIRRILASLGLRSLSEAVGRTDLLQQRDVPGKAGTLDLTPVLAKPIPPSTIPAISERVEEADREMKSRKDQEMHQKLRRQLGRALPSFLSEPISNLHRSVGASLSNDIVKIHGLHPDIREDTVHVRFQGSAGQSFGAFLARGVVLQVCHLKQCPNMESYDRAVSVVTVWYSLKETPTMVLGRV